MSDVTFTVLAERRQRRLAGGRSASPLSRGGRLGVEASFSRHAKIEGTASGKRIFHPLLMILVYGDCLKSPGKRCAEHTLVSAVTLKFFPLVTTNRHDRCFPHLLPTVDVWEAVE